MPLQRYRDDAPAAVRVYTVCDESKYLIVRNVPALGCRDQLENLFGSYGDIEECKPMDAEDCEPFTDVFWIKFLQIGNARFAKRKLDESVFFGNQLQVSYAPQFETLADTIEKLEGRRKEVLGRIKHCIAEGSKGYSQAATHLPGTDPRMTHVSSDKEYFASSSMNETVKLVRDKLDVIKSSADDVHAAPAPKRTRLDNRRRI